MRKAVIALFALTSSALALSLPFGVRGQREASNPPQRPAGKITRSYRNGEGARPAWVEDSLRRSMAYLKRHGEAAGVRDPEAELTLKAVRQDDLGQTHVRLDQVYEGVPVYGRQVISHLQGDTVRDVTGHAFKSVHGLNTTPALSVFQAVEAARAALDHGGGATEEAVTKLVILPARDGSPGATLTYQVQIFVEHPERGPERHEYFVDAGDGSIVWHYNSLPTGTGHTLYSGTRTIPTSGSPGNFNLRSPAHSFSETLDGGGSLSLYAGTPFSDYDDVWGDGTEGNRQTVAVDAHFGMTRAWDYFKTRHGRCGMDNKCGRTFGVVHYGTNYANAMYRYETGGMYFGDGNENTNPLVSVDIVAHEFTHGVTHNTAELEYINESGAANESFSDIFGTAVEFDVGINPDYLIAEDARPGGSRSMSNPPQYGHPDHYSERVYINTSVDFGGVHYNSGIQNKAFYLLAEGGTHPDTGITVPRITRRDAENIFYRALEVYVMYTSQFADVRDACVWAARDIYGAGSPQQAATEKAWCAVGVRPQTCAPPGNESIRFGQNVPSTMTAGQRYNVWVTMLNNGATTWTADAYKLGSQNPQDNNVWGVSRVSMPAWKTVAPGSEHMFYFTVTAPSTPGNYNFQWRMVKEPGQWFGDYSYNQVVTVTAPGSSCDPVYEADCKSDPNATWNPSTCKCSGIFW